MLDSNSPMSIFPLLGGPFLFRFRACQFPWTRKVLIRQFIQFSLARVEATLFPRKKQHSLYYLNWKLQISSGLLYETIKYLKSLQINWVACLHFINASQRMRLLSQIKFSFLQQQEQAAYYHVCAHYSSTNFHSAISRGPGDTSTCSGSHYRPTLSLRKSNLLQWQ